MRGIAVFNSLPLYFYRYNYHFILQQLIARPISHQSEQLSYHNTETLQLLLYLPQCLEIKVSWRKADSKLALPATLKTSRLSGITRTFRPNFQSPRSSFHGSSTTSRTVLNPPEVRRPAANQNSQSSSPNSKITRRPSAAFEHPSKNLRVLSKPLKLRQAFRSSPFVHTWTRFRSQGWKSFPPIPAPVKVRAHIFISFFFHRDPHPLQWLFSVTGLPSRRWIC